MYAAGLVLFEMCCNFRTQHQRIQKFYILKTMRQMPDEAQFVSMPEEKQIILQLTDPSIKKRPDTVTLRQSPEFKKWELESKL